MGSSDIKVIDKAFEILLNSAKNEPRVLNDPAPSVFLMKFADSGIDLMLSFYIVDPEEGSWGLKSDIYRDIWNEFQKQDIEIPYPYRTVEIINSDKDIEQKILQTDCGARCLAFLMVFDKHGQEVARLI